MYMKPLTFVAILSLFSWLTSHAQDNAPSHPQPDSIIKIIPFGDGRHMSYVYTIGGRLVPFEDVKLRLLSYAPSADEYYRAKTNLIWGIVSFSGFGLSGIAAVIEFANNNKHAGETTGFVNGQPAFIYQQHSLAGAYIFTGLATGFLTAAIITLVNAKKHGREALRLYNRRFE
jgi:hypothetical protein